jgi:PGF-pre-PGF domain-containing protein
MSSEGGAAFGDGIGDTGLRRVEPLRATAVAIALLAVSVALCGALVGPVVADDAPDEPASFYGTATDGAGDPIPLGETVVAVVDGQVRDSIVVDPDGEYGGSGTFEGKLRVDSGAGDEVTFRLGDAGGPIGGSAELEPGVFEVPLTFQEESAETDSDSGGDDSGSATTDSGSTSGESDGSSTPDSTDDSNESTTSDSTDGSDGSGDAPDGDTEDSGGADDGGSSGGSGGSGGGGGTSGGGRGGGGGGGGGGIASGVDGDSGESAASGNSSSDAVDPIAEESRIAEDAYPDAPGTTVVFEGTAVREIVFDDDVDGRVSIREFDNVTDDVPPLPGDLYVVSASVIVVPADARDTSAVVRAVVDPDRLRSNRVPAEELSVYRFPTGGDEWETLPTKTFAVDSGLLVEAETPGFSQFVIAGPVMPDLFDSEPTSEPTPDSAGATDGDGPSRWLSGSYVLDRVGIGRPTAALLALLAVVAVVGWVVVPRRRR